MTLGDRIAVIDKGVLQQVGTPEDLYRRPGNRFVASFMGSPSMNLAAVAVRGRAPVTVAIGGQDFEVPDALRRWPDLARYVGSKVVMGLRPAAFSSAAPRSGSGLLVLPLGVESLGDEKHVLFDAPSTGATTPSPVVAPVALGVPVAVDESTAQLWTAKVSQYADLAIGRPVLLSVDLTMAYFFDPETGLAIQEVPAEMPEAAGEAARSTSDPVAPVGS
jgi:multiple sugar transport system ATP-binding protein